MMQEEADKFWLEELREQLEVVTAQLNRLNSIGARAAQVVGGRVVSETSMLEEHKKFLEERIADWKRLMKEQDESGRRKP